MDTPLLEWLAQIGLRTFQWALGIFLVINVAAVVVLFRHRDRGVVNRWTGRILAVDLLLVGVGAGVPIVTSITRLAVVSIVRSPTAMRVVTSGIAAPASTPDEAPSR